MDGVEYWTLDNPDGTTTLVEVDAAFAAEMRQFDARMERRDRKWRRRTQAASQIGQRDDPYYLDTVSADLVVDARWGEWEGPRLHFHVLLGTSATWDGPESRWVKVRGRWRCRGCGQFRGRLPASHYCLYCDRCGREHLIPSPTVRRRPRRDGRLLGGLVGLAH